MCDYVSLDYIAQLWRSHVFIEYKWEDGVRRSGGLGAWAECRELPGRKFYLKPTTGPLAREMATREKIASDLAFDLGAPVSPVVLTRWPAGGGRVLCASLKMHPKMTRYDIMLQGPHHLHSLGSLPQVAADAARGLAFDTWVGQLDHGRDSSDNVEVAVPESNGADLKLVFMDYANSLGRDGAWGNGCEVKDMPFPDLLTSLACSEELGRMISRIEELEESSIRNVVNRLREARFDRVEGVATVQGLLNEPEADMIIHGLLERRTQLRDFFALRQFQGVR